MANGKMTKLLTEWLTPGFCRQSWWTVTMFQRYNDHIMSFWLRKVDGESSEHLYLLFVVELTQLTRWVAASGGCTGTPSLPFFPLEPQTLGWKRKHESKLHFIKTNRAVEQEKEMTLLCCLLYCNKCSSSDLWCSIPGDSFFVSTGFSLSLEMRMQ